MLGSNWYFFKSVLNAGPSSYCELPTLSPQTLYRAGSTLDGDVPGAEEAGMESANGEDPCAQASPGVGMD